jgi:acyl carrier protein
LPTVDIEQFRAELYPVLAELSDLPVDRIHGALRLNEDLQLDSLKRIEVVSRISDKYEFEPEIDTIMELRTVDDIIRLMEEHLRGQ